jgi:hypothetical protein
MRGVESTEHGDTISVSASVWILPSPASAFYRPVITISFADTFFCSKHSYYHLYLDILVDLNIFGI